MKKASRICVVALTVIALGLIAVLAFRAFTAFIVTGVNYLDGEDAVSQSAAPPWAVQTAPTLAPGDDPSWDNLTDQVPVDITAEELGRAVTGAGQTENDQSAEDQAS